MKTRNLLLIAIVMAIVVACNPKTNKQAEDQQSDEINQQDKDLLVKAQALFKPLPQIAENKDNPITPEKVLNAIKEKNK